jgi:AcrR family transcriptional regulator
MPRISAAREEATRQRILKAAREVFVDKGLDRASIDDVVAAAGLSVGAIYNYFPTKDELIRQSIDSAVKQETAAILADTQAAGSAAERIDRGLRGWWKYTMEVPGGAAFLAQAWGAASRRPLIRDLMARRFERGVTANSMLFHECIKRGELPADLDVDSLARTVQALLDGMILEYVVSGGSLRRADAQQRVRFVLDAVMAPQAADVHRRPAVSR